MYYICETKKYILMQIVPKKRSTSKAARNEMMVSYYLELLKLKGADAAAMSKEWFYDKCGSLFNVGSVTAGRIIRQVIRDKDYVNYLSPQEKEEYLNTLKKLHENSAQ